MLTLNSIKKMYQRLFVFTPYCLVLALALAALPDPSGAEIDQAGSSDPNCSVLRQKIEAEVNFRLSVIQTSCVANASERGDCPYRADLDKLGIGETAQIIEGLADDRLQTSILTELARSLPNVCGQKNPVALEHDWRGF